MVVVECALEVSTVWSGDRAMVYAGRSALLDHDASWFSVKDESLLAETSPASAPCDAVLRPRVVTKHDRVWIVLEYEA